MGPLILRVPDYEPLFILWGREGLKTMHLPWGVADWHLLAGSTQHGRLRYVDSRGIAREDSDPSLDIVSTFLLRHSTTSDTLQSGPLLFMPTLISPYETRSCDSLEVGCGLRLETEAESYSDASWGPEEDEGLRRLSLLVLPDTCGNMGLN